MQSGGGPHARRLKAFDAFLGAPGAPLKRAAAEGGVPEAWFLGPKAENKDLLIELVTEAIEQHSAFRQSFHPEDPVYITDAIKRSPDYRDAVAALRSHAADLFQQMRHSAPLFSMRSQGHMLWDQVLPGLAGYFGAMLCNQNNVAAEASPVTTQLEIDVGNDLCRMLGFSVPVSGAAPAGAVPWGHITCDGSVANIEAAWAARNAKFFALALREALRHEPGLSRARDLQVRLLDGASRRLIDIDDAWTLVNLKIDDVVTLPETIEDRYGVGTAVTTAALQGYSAPNVGLVDFYARYLPGIGSPVLIAPATRHYSWPKAATLLGLGQNGLIGVHVDLEARMDLGALRVALEACLAAKRPVVAVVAVIGSTEESAVDPLRAILDMRAEFRARGLDFAVHADAAWGGYYNTIRIRPAGARSAATALSARQPLAADASAEARRLAFLARFEDLLGQIPSLPMSPYVDRQYAALAEADSVTVDPHKAGYVPYPAGALCYRNSAMRDLISLKAPVVFHSESEPTVGIYGVEGSKPGAAAAAAWLAHKAIPLSQSGYGKILGQCMWTSKRMYCRLVTMAERDPNPARRFRITIFQMLPAEREGKPPAEIQAQKDYIAQHFVNPSNLALLDLIANDPKARALFRELGSDQTILAYSFNFKDKSGRWNEDPEKLAKLNNTIFELCSVMDPNANLNDKLLILTSSAFDAGGYGRPFLQHYGDRLGIRNPNGVAIPFLISTTMDPWTTDTIAGDFLAVVEEALRTVVYQAIATIDQDSG